MFAIIFKYIRLPILIITPYIVFSIFFDLILRFINYNFLDKNKHFQLIFNNNNLVENTLGDISYGFYNLISSYIIPKGVYLEYKDSIAKISQNLLLNIGLMYILYFACTVLLMAILIKINFFKKMLLKYNFKSENISKLEISLNDTNGDLYRDIAFNNDKNKFGLELKLLISNNYTYQILQFSIIFSISLLIVPYITHDYVFMTGKVINSFLFFTSDIDTYITFFQLYIVMEFTMLSLLCSIAFLSIFFKIEKNIIVNIFKSQIAKNLIALYFYNDTEESKVYALKRLKEFNNESLNEIFYNLKNKII